MKKRYKKQADEELPIANEPIGEYGVRDRMKHSRQSVSDDEINFLPEEILVQAVKYAEKAREEGLLIPSNSVYDILALRMGWK